MPVGDGNFPDSWTPYSAIEHKIECPTSTGHLESTADSPYMVIYERFDNLGDRGSVLGGRDRRDARDQGIEKPGGLQATGPDRVGGPGRPRGYGMSKPLCGVPRYGNSD